MFQIDLSPDGEFLLYLPSGRTIEISASATGVEYIKKVIQDHKKNIRNQRGYIGTFPTQAVCDKFLAEKKKKIAKEKAEQVEVRAKGLGIDLDKLEINL